MEQSLLAVYWVVVGQSMLQLACLGVDGRDIAWAVLGS